MGMFNFVLDSFKGEIFDFKVKRWVLVASTVGRVGIKWILHNVMKYPVFFIDGVPKWLINYIIIFQK